MRNYDYDCTVKQFNTHKDFHEYYSQHADELQKVLIATPENTYLLGTTEEGSIQVAFVSFYGVAKSKEGGYFPKSKECFVLYHQDCEFTKFLIDQSDSIDWVQLFEDKFENLKSIKLLE